MAGGYVFLGAYREREAVSTPGLEVVLFFSTSGHPSPHPSLSSFFRFYSASVAEEKKRAVCRSNHQFSVFWGSPPPFLLFSLSRRRNLSGRRIVNVSVLGSREYGVVSPFFSPPSSLPSRARESR